MFALAQKQIFCSEKMVYKLGFVLMALAIFSGGGMELNANENIMKYYIHENIHKKEQSIALFLLNESWQSKLNEKYENSKIWEISQGIIFTRLTKNINGRKIRINVAEINREINPNIEIAPQITSDNIHSRKRINSIAQDAKIAINGTYFKQDTGTPLGTLVINDEIITGPIYNRVALGIGKKEFKTARISFSGEINSNRNTINIDNINQPRMLASHVLVYTPIWGKKSPTSKAITEHIMVKNNIIKIKSNKPLDIPKDGYVITLPKEKANLLKIGDKLDISYSVKPNWENIDHIISGGPYLLKDGKKYIDAESQKLNGVLGRNPRTAVGYTKDNVLIMVTVDGRKEGTSGVTLSELSNIMKNLGCYEAINLDGGSSTVMFVDGTILSGSNIKNTSISNVLAVKVKV